MSFLPVFEKKFYSKLNLKTNWKKRNLTIDLYQRAEGYKLLFQKLESKKIDFYNFVETGILRKKDNWKDGQSTFLFQEFIKHHDENGKIFCVDINEASCLAANKILDKKIVEIMCGNSLDYLPLISSKNVNFYHLDSWDVKWHDPDLSAAHHLQEFKIIEPNLISGTIVMIDDNSFLDGVRTGKGRDIYFYLKQQGKLPLYDKYQIIYEF